MTETTYMDFAATAAIRPATVVQAVTRYLEEVGATPGRSAHRLGIEAGRIAMRCRQALARLLNVPGPSARIAFMPNATLALNTALWGCVRRGDRIVVTAFDHNAVLRPAAALAVERGADVVLVPGSSDGSLDEAALVRALDGARLLCINAASNVLGTCLDVPRLTGLARAAGALSLVDVAQLAGERPFDAAASAADMIALTGHKGLLGPQGTGALWVREGVDLQPLLSGGSGGDSTPRTMPQHMPDALEPGTQNGPGIAGLLAGIEFLERADVAAIQERTTALKQQLHDGLSGIRGLRVLTPPTGGVPIVTCVADALDAAAFAQRLDLDHGVLVRAGLHCAPEAHRMLGTIASGAVRFSLGYASTAHDVQRAVTAAAQVLGRA